jgi:nucleoside 2-deoxyribosyltransferase
MNIYFACSITGGREFEQMYQFFVRALLDAGHQVPTAHLADSGAVKYEKDLGAMEVYRRDTDWIKGCDVLIAEVSVPSHGVGYEIAYALQLNKPVLCLSQQDRKVSKMITGNPDPNLRVDVYSSSQEAVQKANEYLQMLNQG